MSRIYMFLFEVFSVTEDWVTRFCDIEELARNRLMQQREPRNIVLFFSFSFLKGAGVQNTIILCLMHSNVLFQNFL